MDELVEIAEKQLKRPELDEKEADSEFVSETVDELEEIYGSLFDQKVEFEEDDYVYDFSDFEATKLALEEVYSDKSNIGFMAGVGTIGGIVSDVLNDSNRPVRSGLVISVLTSSLGLLSSRRLKERIEDGGRYLDNSDTAVLSMEKAPQHVAARYAAAELFHNIQFNESSPTKDHAYLREGLEYASTVKAMEMMDSVPEGLPDYLRSNSVIYGIAKLDEIFGTNYLDEVEAPEEIKDDARGSIYGKTMMYDVGSSAVFSAEQEVGDSIYSEVFDGDYSNLPDWFDDFQEEYDQPAGPFMV